MKFLILALTVSSFSLASHASPSQKLAPEASNIILGIEGKVYPRDTFPEACKDLLKGGKCDAKAFGQVKIESKQEGDIVHSKTIFSDPDGPQVTEESWEKGGHVQKATIENRALQKFLELEVVGDKVHYKVTDKKDGSVKTSEDDFESNLVVPSTVMAYIRPRFSDLEAGQEVRIRVAVLDRREAFSFVIKKVREEKTVDGEPVMVLQMSPTSIFVKALVDPMFFYVKPKTGEMYAFEGKSALRRKEGEKYKEIVVRTAYDYKVNQFKVAKASEGSESNCTDEMMKTNSMKCSVPTSPAKEIEAQ